MTNKITEFTELEYSQLTKKSLVSLRPKQLKSSYSHFYNPLPEEPREIVKFGKYFLQWIVVNVIFTMQNYSHVSKHRSVKIQVSQDGKSWVTVENAAFNKNLYNFYVDKIPKWLDIVELQKEIAKEKNILVRERAEIRKQEKVKKLKEDAKGAIGISEENFVSQMLEKEKEERRKRREINKGKKIKDALDRRVQYIIMTKKLKEEVDRFYKKLLDTNIPLHLTTVNNNRKKFELMCRIIEEQAKIKK